MAGQDRSGHSYLQYSRSRSCPALGGSQLIHHPWCDPGQVWAGGSELRLLCPWGALCRDRWEGGNGLWAALLNLGLGVPSWARAARMSQPEAPHMGSCMGESCARNRLKPLCLLCLLWPSLLFPEAWGGDLFMPGACIPCRTSLSCSGRLRGTKLSLVTYSIYRPFNI